MVSESGQTAKAWDDLCLEFRLSGGGGRRIEVEFKAGLLVLSNSRWSFTMILYGKNKR